MNKVEAYNILTLEMESISSNTNEYLEGKIGKEIKLDRSTDNGKLYSCSIKVSRKKESVYLLEGSIHDNNAVKFVLLEESVVIDK